MSFQLDRKIWVPLAVAAAVIILAATGIIKLSGETLVMIEAIIGGVLVYVMREFHLEQQADVSHNTNITLGAAADLAELKQVVQDNTRLRLEVEMYRKVYNNIRDTPECSECAAIIADRFQFVRQDQ